MKRKCAKPDLKFIKKIPVTRHGLRAKYSSPTYFMDRVNPKNYSFRIAKEWTYGDRQQAINWVASSHSKDLHLVLSDGKGKPRFTLCYDRRPGPIRILSLQRERTQYHTSSLGTFWMSTPETIASKEFQKKLGGMHPGDFLLSRFIFMNRGAIRKDKPVYLDLDAEIYGEHYKTVYKSIINKFFEKKPQKIRINGEEYYRFRLNKKRIRVSSILKPQMP